MKKIKLIFLLTVFLASSAQARDGFYAGADLLRTNAKHKFFIKQDIEGNSIAFMEGTRVDSDSIGFGAALGYKTTLTNNVYVAPEIFYDYIGSSTKDFYYLRDTNAKQDSLDINYRFGAKLNLGVALVEKFNIFVNAGITDVSYTIRWNSFGGKSRGAHKIAMIYGLGASYDINEKWAVKAAFDRQNFNIQYVDEGQRDNVTLTTYRIGLAYNF